MFCIELSDDLTVNKEAAEAEGYPDSNFKLENFTYKNHIVKELMLKYLAQTNYLGVTVSSYKYSLLHYTLKAIIIIIIFRDQFHLIPMASE